MASLKEDAFICKIVLLEYFYLFFFSFFCLLLCEENHGQGAEGKEAEDVI